MPAQCSRCGKRFQPQGGIYIENATNITFSNTTTSCPECGGVAYYVEGNLNVVAGAIEMVAGPEWSWDLVRRLGLALVRIRDEEPDDPEAELDEVDARLGRAVRDAIDAVQTARPRTARRRTALKVVG